MLLFFLKKWIGNGSFSYLANFIFAKTLHFSLGLNFWLLICNLKLKLARKEKKGREAILGRSLFFLDSSLPNCLFFLKIKSLKTICMLAVPWILYPFYQPRFYLPSLATLVPPPPNIDTRTSLNLRKPKFLCDLPSQLTSLSHLPTVFFFIREDQIQYCMLTSLHLSHFLFWVFTLTFFHCRSSPNAIHFTIINLEIIFCQRNN